jgi:hypothetical protein
MLLLFVTANDFKMSEQYFALSQIIANIAQL